MKPYDIVKKAEEMQVMPEAALAMRIRHLVEAVGASLGYDYGSGEGIYYALQTMKEVIELERYLKDYKKRMAVAREKEITDEMIERARRHPIELILEFTRGKCRCINPEHDDRDPSMSFDRQRNRAKCFACGHSVDSIAAYQHLHGCDFRLAVRNLS